MYAHPEKFETTTMPMLLCLSKVLIDLAIQLANLACELSLNDELWISMCFSAMTVVSDIDSRYYGLMQSNDLKFAFDANKEDSEYFQLPIIRENKFDLSKESADKDRVQLSCWESFCKGCWFVGYKLYEMLYFYFWPYATIVLLIHGHNGALDSKLCE